MLFALLLTVLLTAGCSGTGISKTYLKRLDNSLYGKKITFEMTTYEAVSKGYGGMSYEEIYLTNEKKQAVYYVGPFSMGIEEKDGKCWAVENVKGDLAFYEIDGKFEEIKTISDDVGKIAEVFSPDIRTAAIKSVKESESTGETAVVLSNEGSWTVLYIKDDRITRAEKIVLNEEKKPDAMYFATIEDDIPKDIQEIGEDFKRCSTSEINSNLIGFLFGGYATFMLNEG